VCVRVCVRTHTHIYLPSSYSYNQHVICFKCAGGWVNVCGWGGCIGWVYEWMGRWVRGWVHVCVCASEHTLAMTILIQSAQDLFYVRVGGRMDACEDGELGR